MNSRQFPGKLLALPGWQAGLGFALFLLILVSCSKDDTSPVPAGRTMQVWLHRVNTTGKAQHFQNLYSGFELDVYYDTTAGTFIVKHDPGDTTTLTLRTWLGSITHPENLGYWLDFKNLCMENRQNARDELLRIRQEFNLTSHLIIVECGYPPALAPFDTLNFRISFYIPWTDPSGITPGEEEVWKDYVQDQVTATGIGTISGYSFQHDLMQKYFPDMNKLQWYLDSYDKVLQDSVITLMRKDPRVEVLLVAEDYI